MAAQERALREPWWQRIGIPPLAGNGRFVGASAIDSLGTGLILAFTVLYFARTTSVSLAEIGAAMTLARLLALPVPVLAGPLIDRFTARRTAACGNLVSVVGYLGFLLAGNLWQIVVVVFLVQIGHSTYWTSSGGLVVLASHEDDRTSWFGFMTALRNTSIGLGGALAAAAFALGETTALHGIVIGNAASYVLASVLLLTWRPSEPPHEERPTDGQAGGGGYRTVLRDSPYVLLIGVNATLVYAQMLIKVLLAIYVVDALDLPAWIAGALMVVNAGLVSLTQTLVSRRASGSRTTRVVMLAALLNAASFAVFAAVYAAPDVIAAAGLFLAMTVFTFGEILAFPAVDTLSVSMPPARLRGRYLATYQLSWTVGEVTAPGLLTLLLDWGQTLPMLFLLALSLVALPLLRALERRTGAGEKTAEPVVKEAV